MSSQAPTFVFAGGGTGGHVYPMIAVAEALVELAQARVVCVGTARGVETRVVPERGFELELLEVLPIRGGGVGGALRGATRAAAVIPEARQLLRRLQPRAVFSVGGYAAGPVSLAARTLGVPLGLLEPNCEIGLANRLIAPFVQRAYTAFDETARFFRGRVVRRTGVPIRKGFQPRSYRRQGEALRVLVVGGSQGARALNLLVPRALAAASTPVQVVHQTGRDKAEEVRALYQELGHAEADIREFIDEVPEALANADLVIGRAGASTVSEICALGRPAILVPYPHAGDHQRYNARSLEAAGAAKRMEESELTPELLAAVLDELSAGDALAQMAERARGWGNADAAFEIARDLLALAGCDSGGPEPAQAGEKAHDPMQEAG